MPTDLQLIDGIDKLREAWQQTLPRKDAALPSPALAPERRVVEAWIQAQDGRTAAPGAAQRRLRALGRALLDPNANGSTPVDAADKGLLNQAEALRSALAQASQRRLAPLSGTAGGGPERALEELAAWQELMPSLGGLKGWRFLASLGRPVVVPEARIRRFLWRVGVIAENEESREQQIRASHDMLRHLSVISGLAPPTLDALLNWHTRRGSNGGGWCAATPHCAPCPLKPHCAWARFHPEGEASGAPAEALRSAIEPARRRLAEGQGEQLSEAELLAMILQGGTRGVDRLTLADALLRQFGGLRGLERASVAELDQVKGLGRQRALQIKAMLELGRRYAAVAFAPGDPIRSSTDVWRAYRWRFRHLPQEHFVVVLLDIKNRVIQDHIVSKGTLNGSLAHPREVFHLAVKTAAASVILLHNHPSGDPSPSPEDHEVTARLKEAGEILGIRVLDHIILGADDYYSFRDED